VILPIRDHKIPAHADNDDRRIFQLAYHRTFFGRPAAPFRPRAHYVVASMIYLVAKEILRALVRSVRKEKGKGSRSCC
jgi:hypothetical protein